MTADAVHYEIRRGSPAAIEVWTGIEWTATIEHAARFAGHAAAIVMCDLADRNLGKRLRGEGPAYIETVTRVDSFYRASAQDARAVVLQGKIGSLARHIPTDDAPRADYRNYLAALASEIRLWGEAVAYEAHRVDHAIRETEKARRA